jgi:hypothetical protein
VPITVTSSVSGPGVGQVPAGDGDTVRRRQVRDPLDDRVERLDRERRRQREREQREPRRRAHRRDIAEVDGERAVADGAGRREAAVEVDSLDQRVDGEDLDPVLLRLGHRRIVADADGEPRGSGREPLVDARDEGALAEVEDGGHGRADRRAAATSRSRRRGFPGSR